MTSRVDDDPMEIMGFSRRLFQIKHAFRMARSDLREQPVFHTRKDPIHAHLTVVMSAMAVGSWLGSVSGWSLKKLVQQLRGYREVRTNADGHEAVAAVQLPPELYELVNDIKRRAGGKPY